MNILNFIESKDVCILKAINISFRCKFLDVIMPVFTFLASKLFLLILCFSTVVNQDPYIHNLGIRCSTSLVLSTVLSQIIKKTTNRGRPFLSMTDLYINKIGIDKYSFPSGHTNAAFTTAVMISLFYPNLSILLFSMASLVGISRIYLGVHYPTDVIAGMILGSFSSVLIYYF